MLRKSLLLAIAFMVVGLAVVTQVSAQTAAQQKELEQIAKRSMNGLSPQDRQRVVQIMTDMFVAQGMSRQQAAQMAEVSADTLFLTDIVETPSEITSEQRRQLEEQQRADQRAQQPQQPQQPAQQQQKQQGEVAGWPTQIRDWGFANLKQPSGTQSSYTVYETRALEVFLTGANANTFQNIKQQIDAIAGRKMAGSGNNYTLPGYRSGSSGRSVHVEIYLIDGNQIQITFRESQQ